MPDYPTGPGRRSSRGAVVEAYVDTDALELDCPMCHAPAGSSVGMSRATNGRCRVRSGLLRRLIRDVSKTPRKQRSNSEQGAA